MMRYTKGLQVSIGYGVSHFIPIGGPFSIKLWSAEVFIRQLDKL